MLGSSGSSSSPRPSNASIAATLLSGLAAMGAAALLLARRPLAAGGFATIAATVLVAAHLGAEAGTGGFRETVRRTSDRAYRFQFGWRLASAIFDASILLPLAWVERAASPRVSVVALVGFGAAYLVAYELARGEGVGFRGWQSMTYRIVTAALLLLAVFGLRIDQRLVEAPLWAFAALSGGAATKRAWDVARQQRSAEALV